MPLIEIPMKIFCVRHCALTTFSLSQACPLRAYLIHFSFNVTIVLQIFSGNRVGIRAARALYPCSSPYFSFGFISSHGLNTSQVQRTTEELPLTCRISSHYGAWQWPPYLRRSCIIVRL